MVPWVCCRERLKKFWGRNTKYQNILRNSSQWCTSEYSEQSKERLIERKIDVVPFGTGEGRVRGSTRKVNHAGVCNISQSIVCHLREVSSIAQ